MAEDTEEDIKPFDKSYVMRVTANNARKSVDISINKTSQRLEEFPPETTKWKEVLNTLHALHRFRSVIDGFEAANEVLFQEERS
ncbi:MAG: hypothetical protein DRQ35_06935 [Gammaproteobacteria bacterium]|nr:MAG: hypothetical protein DRQ35_06935 [Gammaproteobacteria bacterium]